MDFQGLNANDSSEDEIGELWIEWFCNLEGNEMLCEVDRSFIEDAFNLYGLAQNVPNFQYVLAIILDNSVDDNMDPAIAQAACLLYGLIHARFIITPRGLEVMYQKYRVGDFGRCPRTLCKGQFVIPVGIKDTSNKETVKVFCPKCGQVYRAPKNTGEQGLDGAFFGTTFPHLFFLTFPRLIPDSCADIAGYIPRVFGFKIHSSANCACQVLAAANPPNSATPTLKRVRSLMDFLVVRPSKRSKPGLSSMYRSVERESCVGNQRNMSSATLDSNEQSNSSDLTALDRTNRKSRSVARVYPNRSPHSIVPNSSAFFAAKSARKVAVSKHQWVSTSVPTSQQQKWDGTNMLNMTVQDVLNKLQDIS